MKKDAVVGAVRDLRSTLEQLCRVYRDLQDGDAEAVEGSRPALGWDNLEIEEAFNQAFECLEDLAIRVEGVAKRHAKPR
jgi:hypothetical protein